MHWDICFRTPTKHPVMRDMEVAHFVLQFHNLDSVSAMQVPMTVEQLNRIATAAKTAAKELEDHIVRNATRKRGSK